MMVNLGGVIPLSTVDWTGTPSLVVFFRGCPLRCPHCHNRELQQGENLVNLSIVGGELKIFGEKQLPSKQITLESALLWASAKPSESFVSGLVISGGEPLVQPEALKALSRRARESGLKVGVETCGYYPGQLADTIKGDLLDRVFLDIKAALHDPEYARATGRAGVAARVAESLRSCMALGVPLETRITVFPEMPSFREISEIAETLSALKSEFPENRLERISIQQGLPREREFEPVSSEALREMAHAFQGIAEIRIKERPSVKWGPGR
jgi:pyruvate formate lyase activating enzyme